MKRMIFVVLVALTCCFEAGRAFGRQDYVRLMQGAYEADGVTINERNMGYVLNVLHNRISRDWARLVPDFYSGPNHYRYQYELPPAEQIDSCFTFFERAFQQLPRNKRVREEFRYFMYKLSDILQKKEVGSWARINISDEDFTSYFQKYVSFWAKVSDDVRRTMMLAFFSDGEGASEVETILRYLCPVPYDNPYGYGGQVLEYQPDCFKDIPLNAAEAEKIKTVVRPQFETVEEGVRRYCPLLWDAVRNNRLGTVKKALFYGANPDAIESDSQTGDTPMHIAVGSNNIELVKLLLGFGGKTNIQNQEGKTALDLVFEREGFLTILPVILEVAVAEPQTAKGQALIQRLRDQTKAEAAKAPQCQPVYSQRKDLEEFANSLGPVNNSAQSQNH